jgi:GNAT superfamily N-acetyltransferase
VTPASHHARRTAVTIRLRKVRPDDASALAQAWLDQAETYAHTHPGLFTVPHHEGLGDWLVTGLAEQADPDHRLVLVADIDGDAVGFIVAAVLAPHPTPDRQMQRDLADRRVQIEALAVRRDQWRRGVGTRLADAAESWARNRGAKLISAQAVAADPAAAFLTARGFVPRAVLYGKAL